jgi:MvaI/BcnI restriction endonuclease family protein
MALSDINFSQFAELMRSKGVKELYIKHLAENDNSKNQVYLGHDFSSIQILPNQGVFPDQNNFKAKVNFYWLNDEEQITLAPNAQLILYPDYPEVRFSGFLKGSQNSPSELMNGRITGRVMFFGVCEDEKIIGYVTTENTALVKEIASLANLSQTGVFINLPIELGIDPRAVLLHELRRIHELGWINSKRLTAAGLLDCTGTNCGGLTLEAELGVISNSRSEPDFMGYEIKQYKVNNFNRVYSGSAITLMTPEPQGGIYKTKGVEEFVRKYGYPDKSIDDRMNFSGIHQVDKRHPITGLTLKLQGYDFENNKIIDVNGAIILVTDDDTIAASWLFNDIIAHWSRKHNHAAYVPSNKQNEPRLQYSFGHIVLLAEKTDPLYLLKSFANKKVYYDPGIHLDNMSSHPTTKRRSQFRTHPKDLEVLYENLAQENLLNI